jgi:peptidoglycan-associated lipoprotein
MKESAMVNASAKHFTVLSALLASFLAHAGPTAGDVPPAPRTIYVDTVTYQVNTKKYGSLLDAHARYLIAHPEACVLVQGNTDERHSREYNMALGQRAALSVKKALESRGAKPVQIEAMSLGEERPAVKGHNEQAWAKNRRVEIVYEEL